MLSQLPKRFILSAAVACVVYTRPMEAFASADSPIAFNPKEFVSFPVRKITKLTQDTKAFELELPSKDHVMGMPTAGCLVVKGPNGIDGKPAIRPYTPTSLNSEKGYFELIVKSYPDGVVSKYFDELKEGDQVEVKGPITKFKYVPNSRKHIACVAGGSGITPMIQIIKEILNNPEDKTLITLIFANRSEADIILKKYFDVLSINHDNFRVIYVLDQTENTFKYEHTGHINKELLKKYLPAPADESLVLVCGPPSFMKAISGPKTPDFKQGLVDGALKELGYNEDQIFKY